MRPIFPLLLLLVAPVCTRVHREAEAKQDTVACGELREEYVRVCTGANQKRREQKDKDFCNAFENICFSIPEGEPDRAQDGSTAKSSSSASSSSSVTVPHDSDSSSSSSSSSSSTDLSKKKNFTKFCKEFKNRYLYVCPDPFRFGQKAIVFCPVYSEKCQVPLPDKPVVPQRKTKKRGPGGAVNQLCRSYQGFAMNYCNNPLLTAQPQYRTACDKYWRYCGKFHQQG